MPFTPRADDSSIERYVLYEPVTLGLPCSDVRKVDVSNMTFRARDPGRVSDPGMRGPIEYRFRDGQATPAISWTTTIARDRWATFNDGSILRVVSIVDSHGTGYWEFVSVLSCRDGGLREVFQAGGEGLFLDHRRISGDTIRMRWAVWRVDSDGHCCPSRERIQDFAWVIKRLSRPWPRSPL